MILRNDCSLAVAGAACPAPFSQDFLDVAPLRTGRWADQGQGDNSPCPNRRLQRSTKELADKVTVQRHY